MTTTIPVVTGAGAPLIEPPDLTSSSWWTWAITTAVSLVIFVATTLGHPFNSAALDPIIPSVALLAAGIVTAFQLRGVHQVTVAKISYLSAVHTAQIQQP